MRPEHPLRRRFSRAAAWLSRTALRPIAGLLEREESLADDVSHELRTQLSVIGTASELLLDDPGVAGVARERVERIARAARRSAWVIEALQLLDRKESASTAAAVDLRDIVGDVVETCRPVALAKGIELHAECGDEVLARAPAGMAAIVLQNLIENAIRFTQRGSVRVILEPGRLIVEDTGVGLAAVDKDRIFERGYRSDTSRGSGLGLDLVRRACARLEWQVSAQERPGGGARFELLIARPPIA